MFSHLLEADTGAYNCSAYTTSPLSVPDVITSDSTSASESISVGRLQAPIVSVLPIQGISVEAGGQDTITCIAIFDECLVERPTLVWEFPESRVDITVDDQLGIRATTTRTLTFNRIRTSQAGVYTCRATIHIQGIDSLSWNASQTVQVQIPHPVTINQTIQVQTAGPDPATSGSDNKVAIIGGVVAIMIVLIIAATTAIIVALVLRSQKAKFSPNKEPLPDGRETLGSMIAILSPTNQETEFYETIATGHEYEILDKYHGNQVYEISPTAEPKPETIQLQATGDYNHGYPPQTSSNSTNYCTR